MWWVVPGVALVAVAFGARWVRSRRNLDLVDALTASQWLWPLKQYALHRYIIDEAHKDLFAACRFYVTVEGVKIPTIRPRHLVEVRLVASDDPDEDDHYRVKVRVARGFPQGNTEDDVKAQQEVVNNARGTMGLGPVDTDWHFLGKESHVILTPRKVVPRQALGEDPKVARKVARHLSATRRVPALGIGGRAITHSTTDDASHVLLSGTTMGGGKSETLKTYGLQSYAPSILTGRRIPGADLVIFDTTRKFSHSGWAIDYQTGEPWPGITVVTELDEAARYLVLAAAVMEERGRITKEHMLRGRTVRWSQLVMLLDDVNGLMATLKDRGYDDARHANSMILWHARGVNVHRFDAFQRASARAADDGDNREAYGGRWLADGSEKTGDMLADGVDRKKRPKPKPHKEQPGHCVFVYGSLAFEGQRILYSDDEARRICQAEAHRRQQLGIAEKSWFNEPRILRGLEARNRQPAPAQPTIEPMRAIEPGDPPPNGSSRPIELRTFIEENDVDLTLAAIRYASHNDPKFPKAVGTGAKNAKLYPEVELFSWLETRARTHGDPIVYFICLGGENVVGGKVKIGTTTALEQRLKDMTLHADWVRKTVPGGRKVEAEFHERFAEYRIEGDREWFRIEGTLAEFLGAKPAVAV